MPLRRARALGARCPANGSRARWPHHPANSQQPRSDPLPSSLRFGHAPHRSCLDGRDIRHQNRANPRGVELVVKGYVEHAGLVCSANSHQGSSCQAPCKQQPRPCAERAGVLLVVCQCLVFEPYLVLHTGGRWTSLRADACCLWSSPSTRALLAVLIRALRIGYPYRPPCLPHVLEAQGSFRAACP